MIDPPTYERYEEATALARRHGLALPEVLDAQRLLLTQSHEQAIRITVLDDVLRRLSRQSANKLMAFYYGRVDGTPEEMFRAMQLWLETVQHYIAKRTLEDL